MEIQPITSIMRVQRVNTSQYRLQKSRLPATVMTGRVVIQEELKAYGSIPDKFKVEMTSKGPRINVTL